MRPIPDQRAAASDATAEAGPSRLPSALPALEDGLGERLAATGARRPSALIRWLQGASAAFVSVLLLALVVQGPWSPKLLAASLFVMETNEGEDVATPSAVERIRNLRKLEDDSVPPVWATQRLHESEPRRVAIRSTPAFVDSRSGKQRVYFLRHLLI